jgi:DNA adenine methylase
MLSINDHPDIRDLFADFNISTTKIKYSVGQVGVSREQKHELIITNY